LIEFGYIETKRGREKAMKVCQVLLGSVIAALMACPLAMHASTILGNILAPYPALQNQIQMGGVAYSPGAAAYGPVGTPLILTGSGFGTSGTVQFPGPVKGTTVLATVTSWGSTSLVLTVPATATSGLVVVTSAGFVSNGLPFVVTNGTYPAVAGCPLSPPSTQLQITTSTLPDGVLGQAYNATLTATGGTPPYSWYLTGNALPTGLSLSASTGVIRGTARAEAGPIDITVRVVDSRSQSTDAVISLTIDAPACTAKVEDTMVPLASRQSRIFKLEIQ
jgi:hypothetical protein